MGSAHYQPVPAGGRIDPLRPDRVIMERTVSGLGIDAIIGTSPVMKRLKANIRLMIDAARTMPDDDFPPVLIQGETGTGKELVARALHAHDPRRRGAMIEINCASIPSQLLEAELFGYQKGAFTDASAAKVGLVEAAEGGTLFLDEIGEIDLSIQAKLLKLLEDRTVRRLGSVTESRLNVRIVSATNRNLEEMVREGLFRSDLYFRLRVLSLVVPPLRTRGSDILLLAHHFLALHDGRYGKRGLYFSAETEQALLQHDWPGNVREMRNMLEQTALLAGDEMITPDQLKIQPRRAPGYGSGYGYGGCACGVDRAANPGGDRCGGPGGDPTLDGSRAGIGAPGDVASTPLRAADMMEDRIRRVLEETDWNVSLSAKQLGVPRALLRARMIKLGLNRPGLRAA